MYLCMLSRHETIPLIVTKARQPRAPASSAWPNLTTDYRWERDAGPQRYAAACSWHHEVRVRGSINFNKGTQGAAPRDSSL